MVSFSSFGRNFFLKVEFESHQETYVVINLSFLFRGLTRARLQDPGYNPALNGK